MSRTIGQVVTAYAENAGTSSFKPASTGTAGRGGTSVFSESDHNGDILYSFGHHFPLAICMPADDGSPRGWWLANSDTYSASTSSHQSEVRSALKLTGLPVLLVPFTVLRSAGIARASIRPAEILPDRYDRTERAMPASEVPSNVSIYQPGEQVPDYRSTSCHAIVSGGTATVIEFVHRMGESLFSADFESRGRAEHALFSDPLLISHERGSALFLSSFDLQERGNRSRGYFMCQLPAGAGASTVAQAIEVLKPPEVVSAEHSGLSVSRQGDVFAVPQAHISTRDLPGPSEFSAHVLGTSHVATEARMAGQCTYARGYLRHRPLNHFGSWDGTSQHVSRKMGDGRTWHLLVKNTVPAGRSWQVSGDVD